MGASVDRFVTGVVFVNAMDKQALSNAIAIPASLERIVINTMFARTSAVVGEPALCKTTLWRATAMLGFLEPHVTLLMLHTAQTIAAQTEIATRVAVSASMQPTTIVPLLFMNALALGASAPIHSASARPRSKANPATTSAPHSPSKRKRTAPITTSAADLVCAVLSEALTAKLRLAARASKDLGVLIARMWIRAQLAPSSAQVMEHARCLRVRIAPVSWAGPARVAPKPFAQLIRTGKFAVLMVFASLSPV